MSEVLVAGLFYIFFGFFPLCGAAYLFAMAKGRLGLYVIAIILFLIACLTFFAVVDIRHPHLLR